MDIRLYYLLIAAFVAIIVYFFPFLSAWSGKSHKQLAAIFWTNFFFGWTGIGWCISFIWAVMR
jgi:hypothetical protein